VTTLAVPVAPAPRTVWRLLAALAAASFAVKMALYGLLPNLGNPDETFQYLEQAHRLVYGTGLVPWEFLAGIRSWLLPLLLTPAMALARVTGAGPETYLAGDAALCALLSLSAVSCGGLWGWRAAGLAGALLAGALNAFWFESVYYSVHPLSEAVAADFLIIGLYLGYPSRPAETSGRLVASGLCLGAALVFRLQLAPAIAVAILGICRWRRRAYGAAGLGVLGPVLLLGLVDWLSWGRPFQSVLSYVLVNMAPGGAERFGTEPWYQYAVWEFGYWSVASLLMLPLIVLGARRLPLILCVALTILAAHSIIPHKEPRFVFPAIPLFLTLAGIASARLSQRLRDLVPRPAAAATCLWIGLSALLGSFGYFASYWFVGNGMIAAMRIVSADPGSCGVAIYPGDLWWRTGGYTRLRPDLPIYGLAPDEPDADAQSAAYSAIIATGNAANPPRTDFSNLGFRAAGCRANGVNRAPVCLWLRDGACDRRAALPLVPEIPADLGAVIDGVRR
jgi:hypothetical protein